MTLTPSESQTIIADAMQEYLDSLPNESLHAPIRHLLHREGKRMRPSLTLMGCSLFKGDITQALNAALAIEVFHNFTLMHDDIMDKAPLRRGQITAHEKWNVNSAILSGDAMLVESYRLISKTPAPLLGNILKVFNDTALAVCLGQQLDMDFEQKQSVTENEYIAMIRLKTSVLLGGALRIGAIIGGASSEDQVHLSEFGTDMGLAFQLWDDYLDVFGDSSLFGKKKGGDILADKKTFLHVVALQKASDSQRREFDAMQKFTGDQQMKLQRTMDLYEMLDVKGGVRSKMDYFHQQALHHLDKINIPAENKQPLLDFAELILNRTN